MYSVPAIASVIALIIPLLPEFSIRSLSNLHQIGSGQAKAEPMYLNCSNFGGIMMSLLATYNTALTILAHFVLLLRQHGPNLVIILGQRAPTCIIWCIIEWIIFDCGL